MNIEQMAKSIKSRIDSEMVDYWDGAYADHGSARDMLERFSSDIAALVRAHALEEAAAVCEQEPERQNGDMQWVCDASSCAKAIRALKSDSKPLGGEG